MEKYTYTVGNQTIETLNLNSIPQGVDYTTSEYVPDILTPEQEAEIAITNEFTKYLKRKSDGEAAYLKLSAEFRLLKLSGQLSEESHSFIEETLTPVRNEVMFGQWKKGLELLEKLGSTLIGQTLYDRLHIQITEYISANY